MASLSQVRAAIATLMQTAVYPNGLLQPSVAGVGIDIRPGWPPPNYIENVFNTNTSLISVWEPQESEKNVTRFFDEEIPLDTNPPNLILTVVGNTIVVSGTVFAGEIAVAIINKSYGTSYNYIVLSTDTLETIASSLSAAIPGSSVLGLIITVSDSFNIIARVSAQVPVETNYKRQKRLFWIFNWSPSIAIRDAITNAIDITIAKTNYIPLDHLYSGRILYQRLTSNPYMEKQKCYRDDFCISVEWETVEDTELYTIEDIYTPIEVVQSLN